jgi:hypothetical protein
VRRGCAGLVLDSGTDAESKTNFLLQKKILFAIALYSGLQRIPRHVKMMKFQTDTPALF